MTTVRRLSADAARRTALAAQGFARPRPAGRVTRQHLRRVFDDIGLIQIDSVNVLVRAQELPLFSRLGPHPRSLIPDAVASGELFEYWSHAASLLPAKNHHHHRWRMELNAVDGGWARFVTTRAELLDKLLAQVRDRGPLAISEFEGRVRNSGGAWWDWDEVKSGIEALFAIGKVAATRRARDFARLYDLPERVLPTDVIAKQAPTEPEARKALLLQAARSLGVATVPELAFYHFQKVPVVKPLVAELVASGELIPVAVDGWDRPAVLHPAARTPRAITGRALVSPFDSLVFERDRTAQLFGFDYKIEIYVPGPKRVYGYYVLPFLLDGQLVGRVDLKSDRAAGVLRVQAAWVEADLDNPLDRPFVAEPLVAELGDMARWLGLPTVGVTDRGNLAAELRRAGIEPLSP